jgi:CRISPR-associated protein Cas1
MIKRTLYFGNPAYLKTRLNQLIIEQEDKEISLPIEDIGVVILDHQQITITQTTIQQLIEANAALITCNERHMPAGLMLNLEGNNLHSKIVDAQVNASEPLKKQLWQQTVAAKIQNQSALLQQLKIENGNMKRWAKEVRSGDPDNLEARAAVYYWKKVFSTCAFMKQRTDEFERNPAGEPPNNLLNYGYAVLRAIVARNLVGSGLFPVLGIFHSNQYNAYCLADDIMEPYRPYVDQVVLKIVNSGFDFEEIGKPIKEMLLQIPVVDVVIDGKRSPLMIGVQKTTASLARCYTGEQRRIQYPEL